MVWCGGEVHQNSNEKDRTSLCGGSSDTKSRSQRERGHLARGQTARGDGARRHESEHEPQPVLLCSTGVLHLLPEQRLELITLRQTWRL